MKSSFFEKKWDLILVGLLWFCIWATYDTDIFRVFSPGFPHNALDLIHGLRAFFPFVAIILAVIFLIKKRSLPNNFFSTPLGLLSIYTSIGIISSVFSKNPLVALYWSVLYGSPIILLLAILVSSNSVKKISLIININWIIAGIITIFLILFFLIQPGVISSITYNFLICNQRPYEDLAGIPRAVQILGLTGTRPTGLGRYAGIVAIVALAGFLCAEKKTKRKNIWLFLFILFLFILLFSKGRTEIIGFLVAMIFIVWLIKKINVKLFLGICLIFIISILSVFYDIPCSNNMNMANLLPGLILNSSSSKSIINNSGLQVKTNFLTLTGRTTGIWPEAQNLFLNNFLLGYGFQADRFFLNGQHAHNTLLQALVQTGLFGTIPLVLAFILVFIYLCQAIKRKDIEEKEKFFLIGMSGVFVFFAVRSITESTGAFFGADWIFLAPIIAYVQCLDFNKRTILLEGKQLPITILGKKIDVMEIPEVLKKMSFWIEKEPQKNHWAVVCGMHGVTEGYKDIKFRKAINSSDLSLIDGMSLIFVGRLMGFQIKERVAGPDLMKEYFKFAEGKGYTNFFLGGTDDTLEKLVKKISSAFPNFKVAGTYSPPFREFTAEDNKKIIEIINQKKPDVLWVAFSLKKQEEWIHRNRHEFKVPVVVGVGAAFKFLSGNVKRAPKWVGDVGFEWLWRFFHEPRITWKRVFIDMPFFFWLVFLELMGLRRYK